MYPYISLVILCQNVLFLLIKLNFAVKNYTSTLDYCVVLMLENSVAQGQKIAASMTFNFTPIQLIEVPSQVPLSTIIPFLTYMAIHLYNI